MSVSLRLPTHHVSFLRDVLTTCQRGVVGDLADAGPSFDAEGAQREVDAYGRLLTALDERLIVPDVDVLEVVERLIEATDESNGLGQALLEHEALTGLLGKLGGTVPAPLTISEYTERISESLDRIEAKLDALLAHHGIAYEGSGS